jgi:hypothetical protein
MGEAINKYEIACKEFLKGCSCAKPDHQEECPECLKAFCNQLRNLAGEEKYDGINTYCIEGGNDHG